MRADDLQLLFKHLMREWDAAQARRPWDEVRMKRIVADLVNLEHSLAACDMHEQVIGRALESLPVHDLRL